MSAPGLCAMDSKIHFFTRDISQKYVQSETLTQLPIHVHPPKTLNLIPHTLLRVNRPLYGISEVGLHWYLTYHNHHRKMLSLSPSIHDPCFSFTSNTMHVCQRKSSIMHGFTSLQTDELPAPEIMCLWIRNRKRNDLIASL